MTALRYVRKTVLALVGLVVLLGLWELYKAAGPARGGSLFGVPIWARAGNAAMPHVTSVIDAFGAQEVGGAAAAVRGAADPDPLAAALRAIEAASWSAADEDAYFAVVEGLLR